ncbi:alpha/beta fold hydrolase [Salinisphaera sp. T31B1]|uniref:alpha/beta fold hydrolase n=1 Tax=Salinisphaera sp. T31B1 TaxID=727963 RepID=UPI003342172D
MKFIEIDGRLVCYRDHGSTDAPAVLFAHPLGMSQAVWDEVIDGLDGSFRTVSWDLPGHGASASVDTKLTAAHLASQALSLADALAVDRFHFVGTSIGGVIGQQLLCQAPGRLNNVVLTNTGPVIGSPQAWAERATAVRSQGLAAMADSISARWFGKALAVREPSARPGWALQLAHTDAESYARCCELLAEADFRGLLAGRSAGPIRLVAGDEDVATPVSSLETLGDELGGAPVEMLSGVGHVPSVEAPAALCERLPGWLAV